ncbi:MAG: DUF3347 domain-containing protein [Ferruginibacter sp.]|nr:DUF3347 domain-containing protein [Ferruginibacter sp.]
MKKIIFPLLSFGVIILTACNNSSSKNEQVGHDMDNMNKDTTPQSVVTGNNDIKGVAVKYTGIDAGVTASIKEIADHYLHIKNALAKDNGGEAASGAKAMQGAISKLDKSLFTAEQKAIYDKNEEKLKESADHIEKNGDKIRQQRSQFALMSEVVYDIVKSFGAGRPIYHDHCPMFNENKGAMWLSETMEIKNPYYGADMLTCGSVEEIIE